MAVSPDAVVRAWFDEVWNQGREETIDRLFAADGFPDHVDFILPNKEIKIQVSSIAPVPQLPAHYSYWMGVPFIAHQFERECDRPG